MFEIGQKVKVTDPLAKQGFRLATIKSLHQNGAKVQFVKSSRHVRYEDLEAVNEEESHGQSNSRNNGTAETA